MKSKWCATFTANCLISKIVKWLLGTMTFFTAVFSIMNEVFIGKNERIKKLYLNKNYSGIVVFESLFRI